jgi:hypothetical protein
MNISLKHSATLFAMAALLLAGCDRKGSSQADEGRLVQPGNITETSDDWGHLALKVVKVHEGQKALDKAPWFAAGGDWTFLECETATEPAVPVLIGARTTSAESGDLPISWGEASITVANREVGGQFVEAFAKAFHQTSPPSHGQTPTLQVKVHTAILGTRQVKSPEGGFKGGRKGSWVATKWFLEDEMGESEVFFNYSAAERRAEFSEKDSDYRESLVQQLAVGLRDGPLPERTLANDPSLTTVGPVITNWVKVASSNESCQFGPDSRSLLITRLERGAKARLYSSPITEPANRTLLATFDGAAHIPGLRATVEGPKLLVIESLRVSEKIWSPSDPQKLWFVDAQGKRAIETPAGLTNWFTSRSPFSTSGRFVALGTWETKPVNKRERVLYVADLSTGKWQKISLPGGLLELVSWNETNLTGVVLNRLSLRRDDKSEAYSLDLTTGELTPLPVTPREFATDQIWSPDGKRSAQLVGREKCVITEDVSQMKREFAFHPYDRPNVYPESIQWVDDRYLVFQGSRTSLIDTKTLKMNYPTAKESGMDSIVFSPDFKEAISVTRDGHHLGHVVHKE